MEKYHVAFYLNNSPLCVEQVPRCWQGELQGCVLCEGASAALGQDGFTRLQTGASTGQSRAQHRHSSWHLCGNVFQVGHRQEEVTKRVRNSRGTPRSEEEELLHCGAAPPSPKVCCLLSNSVPEHLSQSTIN